MWAWAHEKPKASPSRVDASDVLAVLVVHNGEQWLPRTLVALARLEIRPGRLIAVDANSTDGSRRLLDKGQDDGLLHGIIDGHAEQGFGANVQLAIDAELAAGFEPSLLWLLHDDSAPSRRCLTELLLAVQDEGDDGQRPAIVVPKLLHPKRRNHPDQMSAVGESIAPSGARVLTVERGDIDQHQLEPVRVLGASTAGLLVTMAAWRQLGGFNPAVPLFRDGVDLGWRANSQGLVVRTCPRASLRHVEAGRIGLRRSVLAPDSVEADQMAGMSVVVMHSDRPNRTIARLGVQSVFQAFGYLLGKSPRMASGQLRAAAQLRRNREHLTEMAQQFGVTGSGQLPEGLLPDRGWGARRFLDGLAGRIADQYHDLIEEDDADLIDELTGDDFAGGRRRVRFLSPAIIGMIVMLVGALVASRHLMRFGLLSGPSLLPAPADLGEAWAAWSQAAPGMAGSNAGWLGLMALGSTFAFGQPDWWATLLVLGGPALAGWSAFVLLRGIVGHGWWTPVLAALWGLLLPLLGITGQGRLDLTVLSIGLPILAIILRRWTTAPVTGAEGLRAPAAMALLIGVFAMAMPWTWLLGLALAAFMFWQRRDLTGALVVAMAPAVMLVPWLPRLFSDPGRLLVGADPATRPAGNAPDALHVLTGSASLTGTPLIVGLLAIGLVWVAGLLGAIRAHHLPNRLRYGLLGIAIVAPVLAVLMTRFVVPVAGVWVRPDPNGWLLIGLLGLLLLAAHGIGRRPERSVDDVQDDLVERAAVLRGRTTLGAITAVAVLAGGLWWVLGGTAGLTRQTETLPSYVVGVQASDRATRTLMVDLSAGTAHFNVASTNSPQWGTAESAVLSTSAQATDELRQVAQQFAQGQASDDLAGRLETLGIGHVWLRGASAEAVSSLSSAPQIGMAPVDSQTVIFTVTTQPSRAMLRTGNVDAEEPILEATVPEAPDDALIVLSEPADRQWRAEIDGQPLPVADSGDWRQAWSTEGRSGKLSYRLGVDVFGVVWQSLGLLTLIVLAAPTAQRSNAPRRALSSHSTRNRGSDR